MPEEKVEKGIADGTFVDYAWKGHQLSCTTMASIKQVTDKVTESQTAWFTGGGVGRFFHGWRGFEVLDHLPVQIKEHTGMPWISMTIFQIRGREGW